jgi:hypothetical protein
VDGRVARRVAAGRSARSRERERLVDFERAARSVGVGGLLEYVRDVNVQKGATLHAVVVNVTVNDPEAAMAALEEQVVPGASGAPGFVAGYRVRLGENRGASVVVFESEDAARAAAAQAQEPGEFDTFDSVEVGEVIASA